MLKDFTGTFGDFLVWKRKERDMTIKDISKLLKMSGAYYSFLETGWQASTVRSSVLNEEEVPRDIGQPWSGQYLRRILRNERYTGDCLLQKSFVADTGRQVRNKGQMDKYYVREHHPAIISREDWEAAQRLREARTTKRYPLTSMLKCVRCGASLIRVVAERKWVTWVCRTYLRHGKSACAGTRLPDHIAQAFHEENPITVPMTVQEADDARSAKKRTPEHYRFTALSQSTRP